MKNQLKSILFGAALATSICANAQTNPLGSLITGGIKMIQAGAQKANQKAGTLTRTEPQERRASVIQAQKDDLTFRAASREAQDNSSETGVFCGSKVDSVSFVTDGYTWPEVKRYQLIHCTIPADAMTAHDGSVLAYARAMATYAANRNTQEPTKFGIQATAEDMSFLKLAVKPILEAAGVPFEADVIPKGKGPTRLAFMSTEPTTRQVAAVVPASGNKTAQPSNSMPASDGVGLGGMN